MNKKNRPVLAIIAAVLVVACGYFMGRALRTGSPGAVGANSPLADEEDGGAAALSAIDHPAMGVERRSPAPEGSSAPMTLTNETHRLRVIIDGIPEADAPMASVQLTAEEESDTWPRDKVQDTWRIQGMTSEFDLGPYLQRVTKLAGGLRNERLTVRVDHPLHFSETVQLPLSIGTKHSGNQTVYEVRVQFAAVVFWPEFKLSVRAAATRKHLEDVELRSIVTAFMGITERPSLDYPYTMLGNGLSSPVTLAGGREADESEAHAAGIAVEPRAGEIPRPIEFTQPEENARGVMIFARAPGYAWGRLVVDVSKNAERELLLTPSAELDVQLTNVQFEAYAALEKPATLIVKRKRPNGTEGNVWSQRLDENHETDGLRIDGLEPGDYTVSIELGTAFTWRKRKVLATEHFSLAAGEVRKLEIALSDAPLPAELTTLSGKVSFPTFGGEDNVRLQLYMADYKYGEADFELSLFDMKRVGGALPTWSFQLKNLPAGIYQVQLMPFMKNWIVDVPVEGLANLDLTISELAEVVVETVDAKTGKRIPLEEIRYGTREEVPGRVNFEWSTVNRNATSFEDEPGRFRFWTAPGPAYVSTWRIPEGLNVGSRRKDLSLVPGLQSTRLELTPPCAIYFEFRVDGAPLPREDAIFNGLGRSIHAVDHEGTAPSVSYEVVPVSAPGLYELTFEGVGSDRFLPIQPRRIDVREGETAEVVVELRRK